MQCIDDLNTGQAKLGGATIAVYILMNTGKTPIFTDHGTVKIGYEEFGLSKEVNAMLDYEILFDEAKSPKNKGLPPRITHHGSAALERCADHIHIHIDAPDGKILDIGWTGTGCTMCVSSASIMTQTVKGLMLSDAKIVTGDFAEYMIQAGSHERVPDSLLIYDSVRQNLMKIECVMVAWRALREALEGESK